MPSKKYETYKFLNSINKFVSGHNLYLYISDKSVAQIRAAFSAATAHKNKHTVRHV